MRLINVTLALDTDSEEESYDAVNEILRENQRSFAAHSCLLDYTIGEERDAPEVAADYYEEGEMLEARPFPQPYK